MQLIINTTPEQDSALSDINVITNPVNRPNLDVFMLSVLTFHLDFLVVSNQESKVQVLIEGLKLKTSGLTQNNLDTIQAVISSVPAP